MSKVVPLLLALIGLGTGVGGGLLLRPTGELGAAAAEISAAAGEEHAPGATADGEDTAPEMEAATADNGEGTGPEYVKLSNQFIVPIVVEGRVASMVILSLNLEVTAGSTEAVFAMEPKLRDRFLQVLFDHANAGGFKGSFTDGANLIVLRRALLETARTAAGAIVLDVLISDIARQDS